MEGEYGDAGSDGEYNSIFGKRVAPLVESDVEEHDGEKFAGLRQEERYIVEMGEGCVAKGGGEGGCESDEDEGAQNLRTGEDGCWFRALLVPYEV